MIKGMDHSHPWLQMAGRDARGPDWLQITGRDALGPEWPRVRNTRGSGKAMLATLAT